MDDDVARRNAKLMPMLGAGGLAALADCCIMVVGIGGVGSNCVEALARGGVGRLVIVDRDTVDASNVNRQSIAFTHTIGQPKVEVMERMVHEINPNARVDARRIFVFPEDVGALFEPSVPDFVVDCQDTIATKLALAQRCAEDGVPLVSAMGAGNKYDPTRLEFADIYDTRVCPLCKSLRKAARARGIEHLRVLYSPERPLAVPLAPGGTWGDRSNIATMGYMPAVMGQMLAADAVCTLLGINWDKLG